MPDNQPTIWSLLPHTGAKHSIFRRHLEAWFPKLSWTGHVQVIDGFAGPGEYLGGQPGSPIIALEVAISHRADLSSCRIDFLFVEEDSERYEHLQGRISELSLPRNITITSRKGSFKDVLRDLLDDASARRTYLPPSFVMIDPFGFEGVPMNLIERIASQPRSEVLISFMYESINRWLGDPRNADNFSELFASPSWRETLTLTGSAQRRDFLLGLYIEQLHQHG